MREHDFISTNDRWMEKQKPQTEEEINNEFKQQTRFKSYHAFLTWKIYHKDCFESRFWEWMETAPIKYDKDGHVYRKRPGQSGLIYRWLLSEPSPEFNIAMLTFLIGLVWFAIVMNIS